MSEKRLEKNMGYIVFKKNTNNKNTNKKENVSKWLLKLYELHGQDKSDWR